MVAITHQSALNPDMSALAPLTASPTALHLASTTSPHAPVSRTALFLLLQTALIQQFHHRSSLHHQTLLRMSPLLWQTALCSRLADKDPHAVAPSGGTTGTSTRAKLPKVAIIPARLLLLLYILTTGTEAFPVVRTRRRWQMPSFNTTNLLYS